MRRRRLAIIGLGRVGRACGEAIAATDDLAIAGLVRRQSSQGQALPSCFRDAKVAADASEIDAIDAALICLPPRLVREAATDLLQHRVPIVEAAVLPAAERPAHREAINRVALRHHTGAVVEAGWEPGMLALFQGLFAVLAPKGHTETRDRPGISLHHTLATRALPGIRDALCTELRAQGGRMQRYVYVELDPAAAVEDVVRAVQSDPLFLGQETVVVPVDSLAQLEQEGHGIVLERQGLAAGKAHQRLLLEGRFDLASVVAQIIVAAARALPRLGPGAHQLTDIPPSALWHGIPQAADEA